MRARGNGTISPYRPRVLTPIARVPGLDYDVLDELLGYSLRRAQVAMFVAFHEATRGKERGLQITPPRFTALVIIGANPGIRQSALGSVLGIARSGAMLVTDWFEARGLVERRHLPDDRRAWGLHLTRKGEQLVERMKRRVLDLDLRKTRSLKKAERRQLLRLLEKLTR
ncbi:MAG: MarR family winged helix-turn-helix transcriptional regulator [Clostridia bacterium]